MIRLHVIGLPASQGSKTRMPNGAMVDGSNARARANLGAWRQAVRAECRKWLATNPQPPLAEPVAATLHFAFPPTKSDPYRFWHATAPDVDKLQRAVFDALVQGGVLADDRYVARVFADKAYCDDDQPAGCEVLITSLADDEAGKRAAKRAAATEARRAAKSPAVTP